MPNKLVEPAEQLVYMKLKEDHEDAEVVDLIIKAAEELLETETDRTFAAEETVTDEIHDGEGSYIVYTNRPIKSLTELVIVRPDDDTTIEYDYDINNDITWREGERRIVSHTTPFPNRKDNIKITYVAQADQPEIAKQAVRELVANIYRRRGSEDARSEHIGSFEHVLIRDISKETIIWQFAVNLLHIPRIG
jgi:hypothetical protein